MNPPKCKQIPKELTAHGDTRVDPYYWLREKENPEVLAHLKAENAYTQEVMAPLQGFKDKLFEEIKGRIKEDDVSVPAPWGPYEYYWRIGKGEQYRTYCRKRREAGASEEVLLNLNELAVGKSFLSLGGFALHPSWNLLAYSIDTDGSEKYTIFIKDLRTGEHFSDRVENAYTDVEWGETGDVLYYTLLNDQLRPYRALRHRLGAAISEDELIYEEADPQFFLSCSKSKNRNIIFFESHGSITSEIQFLSAHDPAARPKIIEPRRRGVEYSVDVHENRLLILTNWEAENFRVMEAPLSSPGAASWKDIVPHETEIFRESTEVFRNHLVIHEREAGLPHLRTIDLRSGNQHRIEMSEPAYIVGIGENLEYDSSTLRWNYSSLIIPPSVFDYDMDQRTRVLRKQDEIPGGYDSSKYVTERIWATAPDGVRIPISLAYAKEGSGPRPMLLYSYGSYGMSSDPAFSTARLSLLERGVGYAIAHIRGGADLGRHWYEDGKFLKKKNTFSDFVAAAKHLIDRGYTSSRQLGIMGGSAGGLLMGAVINLRPELFCAAVARVPFVDTLTTMLDDSLPLTPIEYDEWGNPQDKTYYEYIKSYSPYDNVAAKAYPHLLVTAGLNDPRVTYWEPAKWVAKLRALKTDTNLVLLETNLGAGHGGASGRFEALKETTFIYTFLFKAFGLAA